MVLRRLGTDSSYQVFGLMRCFSILSMRTWTPYDPPGCGALQCSTEAVGTMFSEQVSVGQVDCRNARSVKRTSEPYCCWAHLASNLLPPTEPEPQSHFPLFVPEQRFLSPERRPTGACDKVSKSPDHCSKKRRNGICLHSTVPRFAWLHRALVLAELHLDSNRSKLPAPTHLVVQAA